jgi:hypothetical protein
MQGELNTTVLSAFASRRGAGSAAGARGTIVASALPAAADDLSQVIDHTDIDAETWAWRSL